MRYMLLICIIFIFAGCTDTQLPETDIPIPSVVFAEAISPVFVPPEEDITPVEPDIPPFNEYHISMEFDPITRKISGIESVRYTNRSQESLEHLIFKAFLSDMDIHHVFWDNEELLFELHETTLNVELPRALEPEETLQIRIQFEVYISSNGTNYAGAFSPFSPDVANYIVEITTPIGYTVAGTGIKNENYLDDHKITSFTAPMARNFAFAISPHFEIYTRLTPSDREIRLYHNSENFPPERILDIVEETMTIFEETIGAYPFPQLSIVETDIFRNGESFSNIIFISDNPHRTIDGLNALRIGVGKQWFSIIIGNTVSDEAWLSGGLISLIKEGLLDRPEELQTLIEQEQSYLHSRMPGYENWDDYIRVQYRRARIMLYTLMQEIGVEAFEELLREYFRQFAFGVASAEDFTSLAQELHQNDLQEFFEYWLTLWRIPTVFADEINP